MGEGQLGVCWVAASVSRMVQGVYFLLRKKFHYTHVFPMLSKALKKKRKDIYIKIHSSYGFSIKVEFLFS